MWREFKPALSNERAREPERHTPRISAARTLGACARANLEVLPAEVYQRLLKKIGRAMNEINEEARRVTSVEIAWRRSRTLRPNMTFPPRIARSQFRPPVPGSLQSTGTSW